MGRVVLGRVVFGASCPDSEHRGLEFASEADALSPTSIEMTRIRF